MAGIDMEGLTDETLLHSLVNNDTNIQHLEEHASPYAILFVFGIFILGGT